MSLGKENENQSSSCIAEFEKSFKNIDFIQEENQDSGKDQSIIDREQKHSEKQLNEYIPDTILND